MSKSPDAFRTISEVSEWLQTPAHVLRFWESKFSQVKPVKRAGGRRYYRPADMELLGGIKKLLHDDGMTIKGVQKMLREHGVRHVAAMSSQAIDEGPDAPSNQDQTIEDAPFAEVAATDSAAEIVAFPKASGPAPAPEDVARDLVDSTPEDAPAVSGTAHAQDRPADAQDRPADAPDAELSPPNANSLDDSDSTEEPGESYVESAEDSPHSAPAQPPHSDVVQVQEQAEPAGSSRDPLPVDCNVAPDPSLDRPTATPHRELAADTPAETAGMSETMQDAAAESRPPAATSDPQSEHKVTPIPDLPDFSETADPPRGPLFHITDLRSTDTAKQAELGGALDRLKALADRLSVPPR